MIGLRHKLGINGEHKDKFLAEALKEEELKIALRALGREPSIIYFSEGDLGLDLMGCKFILSRLDQRDKQLVRAKDCGLLIDRNKIYDAVPLSELKGLEYNGQTRSVYIFHSEDTGKKFAEIHFHPAGAYKRASEILERNVLTLTYIDQIDR